MTSFKERYNRNMHSFTQEEMEQIQGKSVCIIGCGGLGGYVAEGLARFGIQNLTLVDGDTFAESNLNRQLLCTEESLGQSKAEAGKRRIAQVNSEVQVCAIPQMLTAENAPEILKGSDLVMDCLDSSSARVLLEMCCEASGIPLIHGAIGGFYAQVSTVLPGDKALSRLYAGREEKGSEKKLGNPPFIPMLAASIQCSEALKLLSGKGDLLRGQLLYVDLLHNSFDLIPIA